MFTVCPKCALTLVVTAADLKVAQGYVRCGRCSNVFNAIVGLSEDKSHQASGSAPGSGASSASTTVIRKAPSISDDSDPLSDTGETEAIYAEPKPEPQDVKLQEVFVEPELFVNRPAARAPAPAASRGPSPPAPKPPATKAPAPSASRAAPAAPAPAKPPSKPAPPPDETRYDDDSEVPESALEFDPTETDVTKVFVEPAPARKIDMTGTHEKLVLRSPDLEPPSPPAPARGAAPKPKAAPAPAARERDPEDLQIESDLRSLAAKLDATGSMPALKHRPAATNPGLATAGSPYNSADEPANVALKEAKTRRARPEPQTELAEDVIAAADDAGAALAADELAGPPPSTRRRIAWISGIAALGVVLAAQAIHHSRNDLATNARFNRPLTRFYAAIGVPLLPNWDLTQYEVRQLGASTGEGENGNLTVRASLKNASAQPLPLPFLRITVQDRYGNRIAKRDVPPAGYMPGAVPDGAQLNVGQRVDAQMSFKDPGRDAVGFEIDACLPKGSGGISCANDAPAAH